MAEQERYTLVFKGELVKGADLDATKGNVGKLFKIGADKLESLFSGRSVTLKKDLNLDAANRYRVAIKKAGARVDMVLQADAVTKTTVAAPVSDEVHSASSAAGSAPASTEKNNAGSMPLVQQPDKQVSSGLTLAPAGADLLTASEKPLAPTVDVDVSGLTVREQHGNLLDDSEYEEKKGAFVDVSQFDLAEVGADMLRPEEKPTVAAVNVDVGKLSIAEPGAKLGPDLPAPPPAPDVSDIYLVKDR